MDPGVTGRLRRRALGSVALAVASLAAQPAPARDLVASIGEFANMTDSPDTGPFIELVKAIDDAYAGGNIDRRVFPFMRSLENVIGGQADFHIPVLRNPRVPSESLPYRLASERLGVVSFVLYSSVERPLTAERIRERLRDPSAPPHVIEAPQGVPHDAFEFPIRFARTSKDTLVLGLQRAAAGRIDAFLVPQEEGDTVLRRLRLKGVHRALVAAFDDAIAITPGPAGEEVDAVLSTVLKALKADGRWTAIYERVHRPYDDWQPAQQGW